MYHLKALWRRQCKCEAEEEKEEEETLGWSHGGVRGAQAAQDMAPSAWDDSTAKHLSDSMQNIHVSSLPTSPLGRLIGVWTDSPYLREAFNLVHIGDFYV